MDVGKKRQIAARLFLSIHTIKTHARNIYGTSVTEKKTFLEALSFQEG